MPVLDLTANTELRWDAHGVLLSTILFPDDPKLRAGFEARWRAENKARTPAGTRLFRKTTHDPAKRFSTEPSIRGKLRKRMQRVERVGTLLWVQAALSETSPADGTETKAGYALSDLGLLSRSSAKRDLTTFRRVLHWAAAMSYQRRVFRAPLLHYPDLGPVSYTPTAALFDFLRLGEQFLAFARESGCFATTASFLPERDLWTLPPALKRLAPDRDPSWPDCNLIRAIHPLPAVRNALEQYDATLYRA